MSFQMPAKRPITRPERPATQQTPSMNLFARYDSGVGKMYPERVSLPQNVREAIRRQDGNTY